MPAFSTKGLLLHSVWQPDRLPSVLGVAAFVGLAFILLDHSALFFPLPLFFLGDADADGGGDGSCASGDSDGSSDAGGCSDGSSSAPGGSSSDLGDCLTWEVGSTSTPFLYVWRNGKFEIENDIMFGKPTSFDVSLARGKERYEAGRITGDLYKIQTQPEISKDTLRFQIREIEPEESRIDHLSVIRVRHPKSSDLFVDANLGRFWIFDHGKVNSREGVVDISIADNRGHDVTGQLALENKNSNEFGSRGLHVMQTGDTLSIKASVSSTAPLFFFLESHFRDWTGGEIHRFTERPTLRSLVTHALRRNTSFIRKTAGVAGAFALFFFMWVGIAPQTAKSVPGATVSAESGFEQLANAWIKTPVARADVRSLLVEYRKNGVTTQVDVIQPRYYRPSFDVVEIPREALDEKGNMELRITATKRHYVTGAGLAALKPLSTFKTESFAVTKALHQRTGKDHASVLNEPHSGEYLHAIPADVIGVEVDLKNAAAIKDDEQISYLVRSGGYYGPASVETQREAAGDLGDWTLKLDRTSRQWLKEMRSLSARG